VAARGAAQQPTMPVIGCTREICPENKGF